MPSCVCKTQLKIRGICFCACFFPNNISFSWKILYNSKTKQLHSKLGAIVFLIFKCVEIPSTALNCSFWNCICLRCASEWQEYQTARQKVIEVMNEAEKKLSEFSVAKAASSHEAEEKLLTHKVRY